MVTTLEEKRRKQLDDVVLQMTRNQESDENIQLVVNDFKRKYGVSAQQTPTVEAKPVEKNLFKRAAGFIKKDVFGGGVPDSQLPEDTLGGVGAGIFQATIGSKGLAGVAQMPGRVIGEFGRLKDEKNLNLALAESLNLQADLQKKVNETTDPEKKRRYGSALEALRLSNQEFQGEIEKLSELEFTPGKALGTTSNAALTALSFARPTLLGKGLLRASGYTGALSAGYQVSDNLLNDKSPMDGVAPAFLIGAALPGAFHLAGKIITTPITVLTKRLPSRMINQLIRPPEKAFRFSRNPGLTVAKEGIVANNLDDLSRGITSRIGEHMNKLQTAVKNNTDIVDGSDILPIIRQAKTKALSLGQEGQTLINRLKNVEDMITHTFKLSDDGVIIKGAPRDLTKLRLEDVLALKRLIGEGTQWTGQAFDKAVNQTRVKAYHFLDDILDKRLGTLTDKSGSITARELNARVSSLIDAKSSITRAIAMTERKNVLGLSQKLIGGGAAILIAEDIVRGDWDSAGKKLMVAAGIVAAGKAAGSVRIRTEVAKRSAGLGEGVSKFLRSLSPYERGSILESTPVLRNYYELITGGAKTAVKGKLKTGGGMSIQPVKRTLSDYVKNAQSHILENSQYALKRGQLSQDAVNKISNIAKGSYNSLDDLERAVRGVSGAPDSVLKTLLGHITDQRNYIKEMGVAGAVGVALKPKGSRSVAQFLRDRGVKKDDLPVLENYIDHIRIGKEVPESELQRAELLFQRLDISLDQPTTTLANKAEKLLEAIGYGKKPKGL